MPSTCVFEFDRTVPVYYSGEVINGRIILKTTSTKTVKEIYILFEGEAKVHWEKRSGRITTDYRSNETYLNSRTVVHGEGGLAAGTHTYTCSIPLPLQCPTSCVEKYGKISYELSLVIDRSWRFNNVFRQPLTVLQTLNLNQHPEYLIPMKQEAIKHFCYWPCSSGSVFSTLTIPFGGFTPCQVVNYKLEIDNQSTGYDLDGIELALKQIYRFVAHSPHHKYREGSNTLIEAAQNERVLRLSKRVLTGALTIPPIPPSSQDDGIISVRYCIVMTIKTGDCHKDAEIDMPITIGTIPFTQNPPSFEEATAMSNNIITFGRDGRNRNDDFIPEYSMCAAETRSSPQQKQQ